MNSDIDIVELEVLLTQAARSLVTRDRARDDGSLLKVGRFEAWLRAIAALPAGEIRRALVAELHLDLAAGFPASLPRTFSHADEDLHRAFEAIGRTLLPTEPLA